MCRNIILLILFAFTISSCDKDGEIRKRLASRKTTEIIVGAREAGETGDKKYVPLLLHDLGNPSASTSLKYKGFTVYTEKMYALEEILKAKPPHPYVVILMLPDSVNIKFYNDLWQKMSKSK